jgi:hypothetical protein
MRLNRRGEAILGSGLLAVSLYISNIAEAAPISPIPIDRAIDSVGIVTHFNYTDGTYGKPDEVLKALNFLGVKHIRDLSPTPWVHGSAPLSTYQRAMTAGYQFDFIAIGGQFDVNQTIDSLRAISRKNPGMIEAIEGFNEVDHQPITFEGRTGPAAAIEAQTKLFAEIKADPYLKSVTVYDLTGVPWPRPDENRADALNAHIYPQNGSPPHLWFEDITQKAKLAERPLVVTEFGYATMPQSGWLVIGVDERTQAKGILLGLMEGLSTGFLRTYVYELFDEKPDPDLNEREFHFGLFDANYGPKASAVAIHNLMGIFANTGTEATRPSHTPLDLPDDLPADVRYMAVEGRHNSLLLMLWHDTPIWDRAKGIAIEGQPLQVSVSLPKGFKASKLFDPLTGQDAIQTFNGETRVTVDVPDHPVIIQMIQ